MFSCVLLLFGFEVIEGGADRLHVLGRDLSASLVAERLVVVVPAPGSHLRFLSARSASSIRWSECHTSSTTRKSSNVAQERLNSYSPSAETCRTPWCVVGS